MWVAPAWAGLSAGAVSGYAISRPEKIVNKNNELINFSGKAGHLPRINVVCWRLQGVRGPQDIDYLRFYRSLSSDIKKGAAASAAAPTQATPGGRRAAGRRRRGLPAGVLKSSCLVLDAGAQEQRCAHLFNFACDPDEGIDDRVGVVHRVDRDLTLLLAHANGVDLLGDD